MLSPAYQSLISKVVPQNMLGTFSGLFYGSIGLVSLPAPWLGAQLWERFSPQAPFIITAIIALITIVPTWLKFKLPDKPETTLAVDTGFATEATADDPVSVSDPE